MNHSGGFLLLGIATLHFWGRFCSMAVLPEYLQVCQRNETQMPSCINNSINLLRPKFKLGIPELDIPPLEPMTLAEILIRSGTTGVAINADITDLKVWGPASFIVTELKINLENNTFNFKVWLPHLHFKGNYNIDMRILLINIKGKGPIEGNFTDYRCELKMKGKIVIKDGEEYIKFSKPWLRLDIGKANIKLLNLFENDQVLQPIFEDVLNENSDVFINEIKPALENTLAEKFGDLADKITSKYSYRELFP